MTYGSLILLAAAPAVIPGINTLAAPISGAAAVLLGLQILSGRHTPWLPRPWRRQLEARGLQPRMEGRIQRFARRWVPRGGRPLPRAVLGLAVAWSGLLLALPLLVIPFSNVLPALALAALGAGLQGSRALLGWAGLGLSAAFTGALGLLGWAFLSVLQAG